MTDPGGSFRETLQREQEAEEAFYRGDPGPFKALFSRNDDVSLFGAFGPCKRGWQDVGRTFDWVANRYRDGTVRSEFEVIYEGRRSGVHRQLRARGAGPRRRRAPQPHDPGDADLSP